MTIRYQTPAHTPAPHAHFYSLDTEATPAGRLRVVFQITYPDREELDEEDITGEGFTLDDDFGWEGELPAAWTKVVAQLEADTTLEPFDEDALGEGDDFLQVSLDGQTGTPADPDAFLYVVQELIQACYEAGGKEQPFALRYVDIFRQMATDITLTATFVERRFVADIKQDGRTRTRSLPWTDLKQLMAVVYADDFDPEDALAKLPTRDGQYLHLAPAEWYDVSNRKALTKVFRRLV